MKPGRSLFLKAAVALLLAVSIGACAKPYHLKVNDTLPEMRTTLDNPTIIIQVTDARDSDAIFSEKAQKEFDRWNGAFVLVHTEANAGGGQPTRNFIDILKQALQKRLNSMQVNVTRNASENTPVLEVTLKKFFLDLKDRNWTCDFQYEVALSKDGTKTGREQVSAQAERTKVMGKGGGEKLIGEIFSEGLNRLDLENLFKNAGF